MRLRDPELAVFVECSINGRVGIDQVITLDVSPHGEFVFRTAYSIAGDITVTLAGARHEVCLTKYAIASDRATPLSVRVLDRAYTVLREADRAGGATTTPMKAAATMTMTGAEMIAAKMEAGVKMKEAIRWT